MGLLHLTRARPATQTQTYVLSCRHAPRPNVVRTTRGRGRAERGAKASRTKTSVRRCALCATVCPPHPIAPPSTPPEGGTWGGLRPQPRTLPRPSHIHRTAIAAEASTASRVLNPPPLLPPGGGEGRSLMGGKVRVCRRVKRPSHRTHGDLTYASLPCNTSFAEWEPDGICF